MHDESLYLLSTTSPSNAADGVRDVFEDVTGDPIVGAVMDLDGDNSSETFTAFRNDAEELERWPTIRKKLRKMVTWQVPLVLEGSDELPNFYFTFCTHIGV